MKNLLLLLFVSISIIANSQSQTSFTFDNQAVDEDAIPAKRTCASSEHMHYQELHDNTMKINRELIEKHTEAFIANPSLNKNRAIVKIPVVVHVLYNLNSQNISNAQINSQIDILNKDFRKMNIEVPTIPGGFGALAADCEIEFALAHSDPNGDSTTGITRTFTTTTSFSSNNNMKFTAQGGHDAWDRNQYLNIWVCKLSSGLLGYAQFPGGAAATDGVVISYKAFGNTGVATAPYNKGRTATHEIGHWLNVFHIWGDDGGSCAGSDLVNDTPNQGAEYYGSPVYPQFSCTPSADGDMFMNYMDYTNDASMSMFTIGQKQRMQALFATNGFRASIANSTKYNYPTPVASSPVCGIPTNVTASNITGEDALITWGAVVGATNYTVTYLVPQYNNPITLTVSTTSTTLTGLYSTTPYSVSVQANCIFGTSQAATTNFTTIDPVVYFKYSNLTANSEISFYPNPAKDNITIELFADGEKDVVYNLYNALGQMVQTQSVFTHSGQNKVMVNVSTLTNGMYILEYRSGIERKIQKLRIEK